MLKHFAKKLEEFTRVNYGTYKNLSEISGISEVTLSRYVNNKSHPEVLMNLFRLLKCGCDLNILLNEEITKYEEKRPDLFVKDITEIYNKEKNQTNLMLIEELKSIIKEKDLIIKFYKSLVPSKTGKSE